MINVSHSEKTKEILHKTLGELGKAEQYALLDYPNHPNIGDHLIWLGELFYINDGLNAKVGYAAHRKNFSIELMEKQVGNAPILFHGGGNLGDLWPYYQSFREKIISRCRDRPIFILPQTLYFVEESNLMNTAKIFNAHPNLTVFVRDNYSYQVAIKYFDNCQIFKAPDMAFQMVNMPGLPLNLKNRNSVVYLNRKDKESNESIIFNSFKISPLKIEDWASYKYHWKYRHKKMPRAWTFWGIIRVLREGWQQDTVIPIEWLSRQKWNYFHPYVFKLRNMYAANMHLKSWNLMHHGVYQLMQQRLVVTNRLHGHILCILLNIPHIFLSNSYYKNEAFYKTWTYQFPNCKFVKDASQIEVAAQELLEKV